MNGNTHTNGLDSSIAPPMIPEAASLLNPNTTASAEELESLFLQFADEDAPPAAPTDQLSLESLFGDGDTEGIMELLRSIEAEASSDPPSQA